MTNPKDPTSEDSELRDTVLTIACTFLGFQPNAYWKGAVANQNPEKVEKALGLVKQREDQARIDEVQLMPPMFGPYKYKSERIAHLSQTNNKEEYEATDIQTRHKRP